MRSTFAGLNTMVRGIQMNQLSQETVGHNISNANGEGYSRQRVNLAATRALEQSSIYGDVLVGSGVDAKSLTRARDIYADRQYWMEESRQSYFEARAKEYDKLESIFDDSADLGIQDALTRFYESWQTLSVSASDSSARISTLEQGKRLADKIHTVTQELQDQVQKNYDDIALNVGRVNVMLDQMIQYNKNISSAEASGGVANDLRDQRDLLVDELSKYFNLNVYENEKGMYTLVSEGISLVNGIDRLTLEFTDPEWNNDYGVTDYKILIKESKIEFQPERGILRAEYDAIDEDKSYISEMATISAFLLSDLNNQHHQGHGIDAAETSRINFFGRGDTYYEWDTTNQVLIATRYENANSNPYLLNNLYYKRYVDQNHNYNVIDPNYNYVKTEIDRANLPTGITGIHDTSAVADAQGKLISGSMYKVDIINALALNTQLTEPNGQLLIAAGGYGFQVDANGNPTGQQLDSQGNVIVKLDPSTGLPIPILGTVSSNGSGDGANSVMVGTLFNMDMTKDPRYDNLDYLDTDGDRIADLTNEDLRSIGSISLNAYYIKTMTALGTNAESMDTKVDAQEQIMVQITEWRQQTAGVNWNEELSNMIMFQQGFSSCSRCLTTMDEMLDRLINSTGVVGR